MRHLRMWLPAALWAGLILTASNDAFSMQQTGSWLHAITGREIAWAVHVAVRKAAHVVEYSVLSLLVARAAAVTWNRRATAFGMTVLLCLAVASVDEFHQSHTRNRRGAVSDVALDSSAAAVAAAAMLLRRRAR